MPRVWPLLRRLSLPVENPLRGIQIQEPEPWLEPKDLDVISMTNADDVRCVSWILRNITDPEALDATIRLAGTIQWFEDGINVDFPYDSIVSTFEACFDPAGKLYPGSRDRAYYSGRAMVWIHILAGCKPVGFSHDFSLSCTKHRGPDLDPDIRHLLGVNQGVYDDGWHVAQLLAVNPEHTPSHTQWISDVLLRYSWATRSNPYYEAVLHHISDAHKTDHHPSECDT